MKKNMILTVLMMVVVAIIATVAASATPTIEYTKINGDTAQSGDQLIVERGDTLDIRVRVKAGINPEKNVNVEAYLDGYEYSQNDVSDSADIFDMDANDTKTEDLKITIPLKAEKDYYDLKVRVGTRRGASVENQYRINLKGKRHEIVIKDILMPSQVEAGRGLFANIKLQNIGQKNEKEVTVRFKIPALNIEEFTTIDEIEADDTTTTEDIVALIDECVKPGDYEVTVEVDFSSDNEKITQKDKITVTGSDVCGASSVNNGEKTLISVPQAQEVVAGQAVAFPIMLTNLGNKPKTYVITVSKAVETFGTATIQPSNVMIVQPSKPETVFVYVKTNDNAQAGQKDFVVTITAGDEKKDVALTAIVIAGGSNFASPDLKKVLEVGLVILIIVLVIVGLIVGFNKLKPKDEEDSKEIGQQTYY